MNAITRIKQLRKSGTTFTQVAMILNKEKFKTARGLKWTSQNARTILVPGAVVTKTIATKAVVAETPFLNVVLDRGDLSAAQKVDVLKTVFIG